MTETAAAAQAAAKKSMQANETRGAIDKYAVARKNIMGMLDQNKDQIQRALPAIGLTQDRLVRIALTAMSRKPELFECTPSSILGSVIQSAQLGLECDGVLGHAHLVPYRNKHTGRRECQLQIGYQGYIELVERSNTGYTLYADVVYSEDKFEYSQGTGENHFLRHVKSIAKNRGEVIAFYAVAERAGHKPLFEVMSKDQVDRIRNMSQAKDADPWRIHYDEQGRKTLVRRIQKYIPKSSNLRLAARLDELHSSGMAQGLDITKLSVEKEDGKDAVVLQIADYEESATSAAEAEFTDQPEAGGNQPEPATPAEQPAPATQPIFDQSGAVTKDKPTDPAQDPDYGVAKLREHLGKLKEATTLGEVNRVMVDFTRDHNEGAITNAQYTQIVDAMRRRAVELKKKPR